MWTGEENGDWQRPCMSDDLEACKEVATARPVPVPRALAVLMLASPPCLIVCFVCLLFHAGADLARHIHRGLEVERRAPVVKPGMTLLTHRDTDIGCHGVCSCY